MNRRGSPTSASIRSVSAHNASSSYQPSPYELGLHYYAQGPMGYGMGLLQIQRFDGRTFTFEDRPYVIMKNDARISLGKVR